MNPDLTCKNCEHAFSSKLSYCPACGQKYRAKLLSLREILSDAFTNFFNLDSKLLITIRQLFIPAFLTHAYVNGHRKKYVNPFRLLFFLSIALIAMINWSSPIDEIKNFEVETIQQKLHTDKVKKAFKTVRDSLDQTTIPIAHLNALDSFETRSIRHLEKRVEHSNNFGMIFGSKVNPELDSVLTILGGDSLWIRDYDFIKLSPDSLTSKYCADCPWWKRIMLKQGQKLTTKGSSLLQFIINHATVALFFIIPLLAAWLKLIYYRRNRYYVEHLVFSVNLHNFSILLLLINFLIYELFQFELDVLTVLAAGIYLFFAMKSFYDQSYGKTFLKMCLSAFIYLFLVVFSLLFTLIIGFLFF